MKLRPTNPKDFIPWFLARRCQHPADKCLLNGDTVMCTHCLLRMEVPEQMFKQYAEQWVREKEE